MVTMDRDRSSAAESPHQPPHTPTVAESAGTVVTRLLCRLLGHQTGPLPFCIWCGDDVPNSSDQTP